MHYTQIASVALQLELLEHKSKSVEVSVSSLISKDIRYNPSSPFVKKRPGIYALTPRTSTHLQTVNDEPTFQPIEIQNLLKRTGIPDTNRVAHKALYLAGRSLDMIGATGLLTYENVDGHQEIGINISELEKSFSESQIHRTAKWSDSCDAKVTQESKRLAQRLSSGDSSIALSLAFSLLELAIELVDQNGVVVIKSDYSSIRISVKAASWNDPTKR